LRCYRPSPLPRRGRTRRVRFSSNIVINDIPPSAIGSLRARVSRPHWRRPPATASSLHDHDRRPRPGDGGVPSWQRLNIPNRFSDEFLDAVKPRWHLEIRARPARLLGETANDDLKYLSTETISVRTDVKFTFGPGRRPVHPVPGVASAGEPCEMGLAIGGSSSQWTASIAACAFGTDAPWTIPLSSGEG